MDHDKLLAIKKCYSLDVMGKSWIHHSALTQKRVNSASVTMANGIYIFGGDFSPITSDFMPQNNKGVWQAGPLIPHHGFARGCGVQISPEELLLIGGLEDRIIKFNTRTNSFTTWGTLKQGRRLHSCVLLNDLVIVAGGVSEGGSSPIFPNSTELLPLPNGTPRHGGNLSEHRYWFGLATFGGLNKKAVIFSGQIREMYTDYQLSVDYQTSVEEWDEGTEKWKLAPYSYRESTFRRYSFGYLSVPPHVVCPSTN